ncbi:carboxypeptidase regulatory-like domain-containing protein [Leptothrix ochracea]|uniref:carboxypeptidase regulatory-like domain-containing protein n=1 Tax=Leptothrix ochracea TaxID=735331 RepID=UPI0034E2E2EA
MKRNKLSEFPRALKIAGFLSVLATAVAAVIGCGGGGMPSVPGLPGTGSSSGTLIGQVISDAGQPLFGATVSVAGVSTTTGVDGSYSLQVPQTGRVVVNVRATGYSRTLKIADLLPGGTLPVNAQMIPVGVTQTVSAAAGGTVSVPSSTAQVVLSAGSIARSDGGAAAASVQVAVTPINPGVNASRMPGDYTTAQGTGSVASIESFGAMLTEITDNSGAIYNVAAGKTATVRIPLSSLTPSTTIPTTIPLFHLDEATGRWVQEGTATLQGVAPNQYYQGTVSHFSYWNADQVMNTIYVSGCIVDVANQRLSNVNISSIGIDYTATSQVVSAADGTFRVPVKKSSRATIVGQSGRNTSNTVATLPATADYTLPSCLVMSNSSNFNVRLTWGATPSDLDSHLLTPSGDHIYYASPGFSQSAPFASLDVDDTSGFGPEVVTASRLKVGVYRYIVHNYSGVYNPGMTASPARVELNRDGLINTYSPPSGEGSSPYWHVFDLTVASDCSTTITTVNRWSTTLPAAVIGSGSFCSMPN